jgi:glycosyltransferase involved in cell wall biosynthesis
MEVIHHGWLPGVHNQSVPGEIYRLSGKQVVVPGRLVPYKGQEYAIQAFAKVVEMFPDAQMILVGDGPHRSTLERLVGILKLGANVRFLGWRTDIFQWMLNSDLALVPSIGEGFGLVFLEAYQAGLPVVAFDVPAANEIVEPGKSGLLAPLWDTNALGDALIQILSNDELRSQMGTRAKELNKEKFSFERVVEETVSFYNRIGILRK